MNDYWLDYPRQEMVKIKNTPLDSNEIEKLISGQTIAKPDRGGSYTQYFIPIPIGGDKNQWHYTFKH